MWWTCVDVQRMLCLPVHLPHYSCSMILIMTILYYMNMKVCAWTSTGHLPASGHQLLEWSHRSNRATAYVLRYISPPSPPKPLESITWLKSNFPVRSSASIRICRWWCCLALCRGSDYCLRGIWQRPSLTVGWNSNDNLFLRHSFLSPVACCIYLDKTNISMLLFSKSTSEITGQADERS